MHAGALLQHAQDALAVLGSSHILDDAYLAGGTALTLHLAHRRSYDLDFYTPRNLLASELQIQLGQKGVFQTTLLEPPHTLLGVFNDVKFSIFRYSYPMIGKLESYNGIQVAAIEDVGAMKLSAICGRATKRDYVDIYRLSREYSFEAMLSWYEKKFGSFGNNLYVIIKALGFFDDAESDDMPQMLIPLCWEDVKEFLNAEAMRLGKKYLEGE